MDKKATSVFIVRFRSDMGLSMDDAWMPSNKLKLNRDKSEVLVICSIHHPCPTLSSVDICNKTVLCSMSAHNIGVIVDQSLSMKPHVNAVCKLFFHLCNIGFIAEYFTPDSAKIIIQALIVSKLDCCNLPLYGLPSYLYLIQNLQHVQNSAAHLITQSPRFCHITPVLKPGSCMLPTYLGRSRWHGLGQRSRICEHLSPTHNLSQALTAGLPANLS